jgi:hypothetical protein
MAFPPLPSTASQYDLRLRRRPRLRRGLRGFVGDAGKRALFPAPCNIYSQFTPWQMETFILELVALEFAYGWIPHNAGFGFLDMARPVLGVFASLDRF